MFGRWMARDLDPTVGGARPHMSRTGASASSHGDVVTELTEVIEALIVQAARLEAVLRTPGQHEDAIAQREAIMATLQQTRVWLAEAEGVLGVTLPVNPAARDLEL